MYSLTNILHFYTFNEDEPLLESWEKQEVDTTERGHILTCTLTGLSGIFLEMEKSFVQYRYIILCISFVVFWPQI